MNHLDHALLNQRRHVGVRSPAFFALVVVVAGAWLACSIRPVEARADAQAHMHEASSTAGGTPDERYMHDSSVAMATMMGRMSAVKPSGDVDRDFVDTMTPHHQSAIDMAEAELRNGHNEKLKRMAQEIIVTQRDEISAMRLALSTSPSDAAPRAAQ